MIQFSFDSDASVEAVQRRLGSLGEQARPVLKKALNATARDARKLLTKKAQETYAIKASGFNKGANIKNASNARLAATIIVTGRANELKSFKVSPATAYPNVNSLPNASRRGSFGYRGKVLKKNRFKPLETDAGQAFIVRFKSGHVTIAERIGKKRLPIKTLYSPSNPSMVGSKQVYGVIRPKIGELLQDEISKQIEKQLRKGTS